MGKDETLTLWRLDSESGHLRCFVAEVPAGFWLGVECPGGTLVVSQTLPSIQAVLDWSQSVRDGLASDGWVEADERAV
jgi:hypothetical protein